MRAAGRHCGGGSGPAAAVAVAAGVILAGAASTALGQPGLSQPPWPKLQQGFEDVEPLARSTAVQPLDLRAPMGFEDVYDLGDGRLARIDGGLIAVFPRSTYARDSSGVYPTIPPGTVFYIGMPPSVGAGPNDAFGRPALGRSQSAIVARNAGRGPDRRAAGQRSAIVLPMSLHAGAARGEPVDLMPRLANGRAPSVFSGEGERQRLLGELLGRAGSAAP